MNSLPLPRPSMAVTLMQWPSQLLDSVIGRPQRSEPLTTILDNYPGPEEASGAVRDVLVLMELSFKLDMTLCCCENLACVSGKGEVISSASMSSATCLADFK